MATTIVTKYSAVASAVPTTSDIVAGELAHNVTDKKLYTRDDSNTILTYDLDAGTTADAALPKAGGAMTGAITTNSTFDGRDVAADGTKLDAIEAAADVTDTTNVTAAGALMDSELAGIAAVKATTAAFLIADESKLDAIEASADVTDATNVTAAGALMDSELTDIAAVKAYAGIPDTNITYTTATRVIASSTGTDATLPRAGTTTDGLMRARLNGTTAYLTYNGTTA